MKPLYQHNIGTKNHYYLIIINGFMLPGLKPIHVKAEPHTLTLDTTEPFSAFKIIKYPSTEPAIRAVPNG